MYPILKLMHMLNFLNTFSMGVILMLLIYLFIKKNFIFWVYMIIYTFFYEKKKEGNFYSTLMMHLIF